MSRPINITSAVTFIPQSYVSAGSYTFTHQTEANAYTNADSTTSDRLTLARNRNNTRQSEMYYIFDTSAVSNIPSNATIDSVTANVKYYVSSTSYVTAVSIRLYAGTTAKGTAITTRPTSATKYAITAGNWSLSELQNARLYVSATHRASNTNAYLYFYGADLTVNYSVNGVEYEVSFSNTSTDAVVTPSTTQYVFEGGNQDIKFTGILDLDDVNITDNGNDIEAGLVHITPGTYTDSSIPNQLVGSSGSVTNPDNGLSDTSSTTYAQVPGGSSYYMEYSFDTSNIPIEATINSVSCSVKAQHTRSTAIGSAQLYAGSTAKGSAYTFGNTTTPFDLSTGTWTASELQTLKLRVGSTYTGTSTYYTRFYGAELTINYTVNDDVYTYTISNISTDHAIEISDANVTKYAVNASSSYAGATVSPATQAIREGRNAVVNIAVNNLYEIIVKDNGTDVTGSLVQNSTGYTYTASNIQSVHNITVQEATKYLVTTESNYAKTTITPESVNVYSGQSTTLTIQGPTDNLILKDNGVDVTSSIVESGNLHTYTISNISQAHVVIAYAETDYVKINGAFKEVKTIFKKVNGDWIEITKQAFNAEVPNDVLIYGGNIRTITVGEVVKSTDAYSIVVNDGALSPGTYKLVYEDEGKGPIDNVDKITDFTIS